MIVADTAVHVSNKDSSDSISQIPGVGPALMADLSSLQIQTITDWHTAARSYLSAMLGPAKFGRLDRSFPVHFRNVDVRVSDAV